MTFRNTFKLFLLALLSLAFVGCGQDAAEDYGKNKVKIRLAMGDYVPREIRGIATPAEEKVNNLDAVFFDNAGNLLTLGPTPGKKVFSFDVANPTPSEWVNGVVTSQTVFLDLQRAEVQGTKAVALLNLPPTIKTQLENGTITTLTQLKDAINQTITTVSTTSIITPLVMIGEADVPNPLSATTDNTINVDVKRLVAKMQVNVYYDWDKLVVPSTTPTTAKSYYTYMQFEGNTYFGVKKPIVNRVDGAQTEVPVPPVATPKQAVLDAVYINEYDFSDRTTYPAATHPSPYILLKLPAILGEDNDLTRLFPPPAGGDFTKTPVDNYYKVVLPERIDRNCLYTVHAHILGPGSPTPQGAPIIQFNLLVRPWSPSITVPGA